ncbi:hypothetical protein [Xylanibacter rodentium]|uniref:hypothetical protein n=1 Tax=Xylanibacter rodentium TaxID=2736289 RepID=UPI002577E976|nr:hypothetical protein [Xylanibacter rodentium]
MAQGLKHDVLKKMKLGGRPKVFRFNTPAEFESARKNADYIQKNCPRPDGARYDVKLSYQSGTITVTLVGNNEEV